MSSPAISVLQPPRGTVISKRSAGASATGGKQTKVIVISTAMLTFISFWRVAAVVLCDLASTAYYIGGIVEQAVGRSAPYFILAVMLFSYAVRSVYVESCSMFTRGGVYRVVKEAMGGTLAKLSVSALMFDYILTGPISGVSAGQYLSGLINEMLKLGHVNYALQPDLASASFAIIVTLYFWRQNILGHRGVQRQSDAHHADHDRDGGGDDYLVRDHAVRARRASAAPGIALHRRFAGMAARICRLARTFGVLGIMIAFGHSILAMSGEESLAQVNREIEAPKLKNLLRAGFVIFIYSLLLTSLISFFAVMIIPDSVRMKEYSDNLIGGLAMYMVGPLWLRLAFRAFVVFVGFLILAGAVNTAIVGSNGVLCRVAEDGVLLDWFRHPHKRFGTSHRIINMVAILQIVTIVLSRGDVYVLGEAYAFGVIWSFVFKTLSMLVLRYRDRSPRIWRVPLNLKRFKPGGVEFPLGLALIFRRAVPDRHHQPLHQAGRDDLRNRLYAGVVRDIRAVGTHATTGAHHAYGEELEKFNLAWFSSEAQLDPATVNGGRRSDQADRDSRPAEPDPSPSLPSERGSGRLVVLTVRTEKGFASSDGAVVFTAAEEKLFSKVVKVAEDHGRPVTPLVVVSNDQLFAIARVASLLKVDEVVMGVSAKFRPDVQLEHFAMHWGSVADGEQLVKVRVLSDDEDITAEVV